MRRLFRVGVPPILLTVAFAASPWAPAELKPFTTSLMIVDWVPWESDAHVAAWSDALFVGEVLDREGYDSDEGHAMTLHSVRVVNPIKGSLPPDVVVQQLGGAHEWGLGRTSVDGHPLLEPGHRYLIVGRVSKPPRNDRLTLAHGFESPIKGAAEEADLVRRFRAALRGAIRNEPRGYDPKGVLAGLR